VTFADDFNKLLAEAAEQMDMTGNLYLAPDKDGGLPTVVKSAAYIPVSFEHLIDAGAMTEEEARARGWEPTVYPPIPRRVRLRWRITAWRMRLGRRIGSWIAGERLYNDDEMYDDE
jgi:hypothetical protein